MGSLPHRLAGIGWSDQKFNNGPHGNQEVPHLHMHIFGGRQIRGRMIRDGE